MRTLMLTLVLVGLVATPAGASFIDWPSDRNVETIERYTNKYVSERQCYFVLAVRSKDNDPHAKGRNIEKVIFYTDVQQVSCSDETAIGGRDVENQFYDWLKTYHPDEIDNMKYVSRWSWPFIASREEAELNVENVERHWQDYRKIKMETFKFEHGGYWLHPDRASLGPEAFEFFYKDREFEE